MMAVVCAQATEKAKTTSAVSYKLLIEMPACPRSAFESQLRDELLMLADHLEYRQVYFTAADCFSVDYTMLFTIFGSVASYIVITLQFD